MPSQWFDDLLQIALKAFSIKVMGKNIFNATNDNNNNVVMKTQARDQPELDVRERSKSS